jgi:hypothetical protein
MEDNPEDLKKKLDQFKAPKKKLTIPKELLEGANNYDDKLMVIKVVADRDRSKVIKLIKSMLKSDKE